jgi:hypothetical protein
MDDKDPIKELAKDTGLDPKRLEAWAKAERLPVKLPPELRERIASVKEATIRAAAGSVCAMILTPLTFG